MCVISDDYSDVQKVGQRRVLCRCEALCDSEASLCFLSSFSLSSPLSFSVSGGEGCGRGRSVGALPTHPGGAVSQGQTGVPRSASRGQAFARLTGSGKRGQRSNLSADWRRSLRGEWKKWSLPQQSTLVMSTLQTSSAVEDGRTVQQVGRRSGWSLISLTTTRAYYRVEPNADAHTRTHRRTDGQTAVFTVTDRRVSCLVSFLRFSRTQR